MRSLCLILMIWFSACAPVKVIYDFDRSVNYNSISTYNYFPQMLTGLSELDQKRMIAMLDAKLQTFGWSRTDTPQVYVNIYSRVVGVPQNSSMSFGLGGTGSNVGGGMSVGIPVGGDVKEKREIVFDLVDVANDALIWQALSESPYSEQRTPLEREERIQKVINKVFSDFPPQKE